MTVSSAEEEEATIPTVKISQALKPYCARFVTVVICSCFIGCDVCLRKIELESFHLTCHIPSKDINLYLTPAEMFILCIKLYFSEDFWIKLFCLFFERNGLPCNSL